MRFIRYNPEYPTRESRFAIQWAMIITLCFGVFILSVVQEQILLVRAMRDVQDRIVTAAKNLRVDTGDCIGWRATEYCVPYGPRNKYKDRTCSYGVGRASSGWCQCTDNIRIDIACTQQQNFPLRSCSERCSAHIGMMGQNASSSEIAKSRPAVPLGAMKRSDVFGQSLSRSPMKHNVAFVMMIPGTPFIQKGFEALQRVEANVNYLTQYPYVFFLPKEWPTWAPDAYTAAVTTATSFETITPDHWDVQPWVDRERLNGRGRVFSKKRAPDPPETVLQAQISRWWAGYVAREPAMEKYDYYWRIDLDAFYYCPVLHNPVVEMVAENKVFGYHGAVVELTNLLPQLSRMMKEYLVKTSQSLAYEGQVFQSSPRGAFLQSCIPATGAEIVKLSALRTEHYKQLFDHLESTGGFFYERWPDSVVRFLGLILTTPMSGFHYIETVAYADKQGWDVPFDTTICNEEYMLPSKLSMGKPRLHCLVTLGGISNVTYDHAVS